MTPLITSRINCHSAANTSSPIKQHIKTIASMNNADTLTIISVMLLLTYATLLELEAAATVARLIAFLGWF